MNLDRTHLYLSVCVTWHPLKPEAQHTTHESAQCTRMSDHAVIETRAARPKIDIQNGLSLISYNGSVGDSSAYVTLL